MITAMTQKEDGEQKGPGVEPKAAKQISWRWFLAREGPAILGVLSAAVVLGAGIAKLGPESTDSVLKRLQGLTSVLATRQAELSADVERLRAAHERLALDLRNADPKLAAGSSIANTLAELTTRINEVDKVILEKPARTLEVHLLRSEVEKVRADYQSAELRAAKDIERVYDLTKWLVGGVLIAVVAAIAKAYLEAKANRPPPAA
jgi:hypothetical protein